MKKTKFIALASLAAAIAAVSCSKEEMQSSSASEGTVLLANIEQAASTKTSMSGATEGSTNVSIVWTAGDKLSVLSGASFASNNEFTLKSGDEGKTSGSFNGASITGDIIAIYPYSSDVKYATDKVILNIPQTQAYTSASFAQNSVPMVAKGTVGSALDFKYLFSAIAFKVNGSGKNVTKVTVTATTPLWGPAEITNPESTPAITMTGNDSKYYTVELTCATAQSITSAKVFYIAVPAGTYTFAVNVYCSDKTIFHTNYTTAKTFSVGNIKYNGTAKVFADNGPAYVEGSYIGDGTKINGIYWAPVNCGYDAADYKCGKLYQWGRMDGCGYYNPKTTSEIVPAQDASDKVIQTNSDLKKGTYTISEPDVAKFYYNPNSATYDWYTSSTSAQLSSWPMTAPSGTSRIGNPCPSGWRVPTSDELGNMVYSDWNPSSQKGKTGRTYTFSSGYGTINGLTLPVAGSRLYDNGNAMYRGASGYYWSSTVATGKNSKKAMVMVLENNSAAMSTGVRASGFVVRCVQE